MTDLALAQDRARPRGDDARDRLLATAERLFASRGFHGVSVRELATAADVNVAAVSYHFGGKRELYLAALEALLEQMRPVGEPVIREVDAAFDGAEPDAAALSRLMTDCIRHMLETMLGGAVEPWVPQTVLREFQEPSQEYRPIFDERVLPLHRAMRRVAAAALGLEETAPAAILRAHAIMGQIMVFAASRAIVLEELGLEAFAPDDLETVIQTATASVLLSLSLPYPAPVRHEVR